MGKKVGIRFKPSGKIYDFDCGAFVLNQGDHVIVETKQGLGYGVVAAGPVAFDKTHPDPPYKKVYRLATAKDQIQRENNRQREKQAHAYCLECIKKLGLQMNLFAVENTFDSRKLTFFFTAEGRVDFRQLVKMLVRKLGVRIEMRQVGIRNQAKICGGIGRCGRHLCCSAFMEKFEPVSIRMAKEQGLSLNPTKISGQCGRLMCCLTYEYDTYRSLKEKLPKLGVMVQSKKGRGKVIRQNIIGGRVTLRFEDGTEAECTLSAIGKKKDRHA